MHQIHHDPKRMHSFEEFEIGVGQEEGNPHDSLAKAYYVPFLEGWGAVTKKLTRHR